MCNDDHEQADSEDEEDAEWAEISDNDNDGDNADADTDDSTKYSRSPAGIFAGFKHMIYKQEGMEEEPRDHNDTLLQALESKLISAATARDSKGRLYCINRHRRCQAVFINRRCIPNHLVTICKGADPEHRIVYPCRTPGCTKTFRSSRPRCDHDNKGCSFNPGYHALKHIPYNYRSPNASVGCEEMFAQPKHALAHSKGRDCAGNLDLAKLLAQYAISPTEDSTRDTTPSCTSGNHADLTLDKHELERGPRGDPRRKLIKKLEDGRYTFPNRDRDGCEATFTTDSGASQHGKNGCINNSAPGQTFSQDPRWASTKVLDGGTWPCPSGNGCTDTFGIKQSGFGHANGKNGCKKKKSKKPLEKRQTAKPKPSEPKVSYSEDPRWASMKVLDDGTWPCPNKNGCTGTFASKRGAFRQVSGKNGCKKKKKRFVETEGVEDGLLEM